MKGKNAQLCRGDAQFRKQTSSEYNVSIATPPQDKMLSYCTIQEKPSQQHYFQDQIKKSVKSYEWKYRVRSGYSNITEYKPPLMFVHYNCHASKAAQYDLKIQSMKKDGVWLLK